MSIPKVSIRQVKAARSLLAWSQQDLARASGVSIPTIKRLESEDGALGGRQETIDAIRGALEAAGVEFTNGGQPGVRLSPRRAALAAAEQYVLEHCEKFVRSGPDLLSQAARAVRESSLRDEARTFPRLTTFKEVEECIWSLKELGFFLPTEIVSQLANAFSSLDDQIAREEEKIARKVPRKASPEKGMAIMRKGLAENDLRKLEARKQGKVIKP